MAENHNLLFGIISQPIANERGHVFGAIFDVNDQGDVTDFYPIDYNGKTIRHWKTATFGRPHLDPNSHSATADKMLLFPITQETADALKETIEHIRGEILKEENPFYWADYTEHQAPWPDPKLERYAKKPLDFDGHALPVRDEETLVYGHAERTSTHRQVATNCIDFLLNTTQKIGGVPLQDLSNGHTHASITRDPRALRAVITELAGNTGAMFRDKKPGQLIDAGEGRFFYALDGAEISLTGSINSQPRLPQGLKVPEFLVKHSKPFYDPKVLARLNGMPPHEAHTTVTEPTVLDVQEVQAPALNAARVTR